MRGCLELCLNAIFPEGYSMTLYSGLRNNIHLYKILLDDSFSLGDD